MEARPPPGPRSELTPEDRYGTSTEGIPSDGAWVLLVLVGGLGGLLLFWVG